MDVGMGGSDTPLGGERAPEPTSAETLPDPIDPAPRSPTKSPPRMTPADDASMRTSTDRTLFRCEWLCAKTAHRVVAICGEPVCSIDACLYYH
jgi:hypothetical protein